MKLTVYRQLLFERHSRVRVRQPTGSSDDIRTSDSPPIVEHVAAQRRRRMDRLHFAGVAVLSTEFTAVSGLVLGSSICRQRFEQVPFRRLRIRVPSTVSFAPNERDVVQMRPRQLPFKNEVCRFHLHWDSFGALQSTNSPVVAGTVSGAVSLP